MKSKSGPSKGRTLEVKYSLRPCQFWLRDNQKIRFSSIEEVRGWAEKHGYDHVWYSAYTESAAARIEGMSPKSPGGRGTRKPTKAGAMNAGA